jgi:sulfur-oxidizing protein SoxA
MRQLASWALAIATAIAGATAPAQERPVVPSPLRSGSSYMGADLRALQADEFANPGLLWVEKGARLWSVRAGSAAKSCADCHGDARVSMKGVAARYPAWDARAARLLDLEGRINHCRAERQGAAPWAFESEELLGLTAFVATQSRGMPTGVAVEGGAAPHFERGRALYQRRIGQMNLACVHCHVDNAGARLLAETISQGHPTAWPGYRLQWQSAGSLQRRLRACYFGVRAEPPPYNAPELLDLSLFLAWRAQGLAIESPGVRR